MREGVIAGFYSTFTTKSQLYTNGTPYLKNHPDWFFPQNHNVGVTLKEMKHKDQYLEDHNMINQIILHIRSRAHHYTKIIVVRVCV